MQLSCENLSLKVSDVSIKMIHVTAKILNFVP